MKRPKSGSASLLFARDLLRRRVVRERRRRGRRSFHLRVCLISPGSHRQTCACKVERSRFAIRFHAQNYALLRRRKDYREAFSAARSISSLLEKKTLQRLALKQTGAEIHLRKSERLHNSEMHVLLRHGEDLAPRRANVADLRHDRHREKPAETAPG